jgi:hypothetical protein
VGSTLAGWPSIDAGSNPAIKVFASDAFRTLLTLTIGLFVTINYYLLRARRRVLEADEPYNIARALAFGYFRDFLVPALRIAEREGAQLQVFRPRSMNDVQAYASRLAPQIRRRCDEVWLPLVEAPIPGGPPPRRVMALLRPLDAPPATNPLRGFYFDAPTALFTVVDFCAALNQRRIEQHMEWIEDNTLITHQNRQMASFFNHLDVLFNTDASIAAVQEPGPAPALLSSLRMSLRYVGVEELDARFPAPNTGRI